MRGDSFHLHLYTNSPSPKPPAGSGREMAAVRLLLRLLWFWKVHFNQIWFQFLRPSGKLGSCQPCGLRVLSFDFFFFSFLVNLICQLKVVTAVASLIPIPPPKHLCLLVWIFFSWARGHRKSNSLIHQQGYTFSTSDANSLSVKSSQEDLGSFVAWEWLLEMCIWILNIFLHMTVAVLQTTWASELVKKLILRCGRRGGKGEDLIEWDLCVGVGLICRVRVVGLFLSGDSSLRISPCWKPAS